jgi:hypothetical protein
MCRVVVMLQHSERGKQMPRYAENTAVTKDRSLAEIEQQITRYGASGFIYGWSGTNAMIGFVVSGRQIKLTVPMPDRNADEFRLTPSKKWERSDAEWRAAYEQAIRQRWRALALYVKATLEAVEAGIITFDDAFLAYTALPGGATVGQWMQPQIAQAYQSGHMPPLLPMPGDN